MLIAKIAAQSHLPDTVPGLSRLTPSWGILRWTWQDFWNDFNPVPKVAAWNPSFFLSNRLIDTKKSHQFLEESFHFRFEKKPPAVSQPLQFPQAVRIPKAMAGAETAPFCAVIGCADLRTPVEQIFDSMPGEIFVLRMLGARRKALGFSYENWAIMITHRRENLSTN